MVANRRTFLVGTASITALGASSASAQYKPRRRRAGLRSAPKIILVSSISIPQNLQSAFTSGVQSNIPGAKISFTPSVQYWPGSGWNNAIDNSADLIVTAGGNTSYLAANSLAQKPFLSLMGAVPTSSVSSNFRGGVSLESWASNKDRIKNLTTGKGYKKNELGLLYNNNSAMHSDEGKDWNSQCGLTPNDTSQIFPSGNDALGNNSPTFNFPTTSNIKAIVISADPYFQDNKEPLINAANNWITSGASSGVMRNVVYPLLDYRNSGGTNIPDSTHSSFHGQDLGVAYSLLGQLALIALTPSCPVTIWRLPSTDI